MAQGHKSLRTLKFRADTHVAKPLFRGHRRIMNMRQDYKVISRIVVCIVGFSTLLALQGCRVVPHQRTLPDWVMRVYVPMADNQSYEAGLEEKLTNALIEEILLDGRLDVVQRTQSNAVLRLRILQYEEFAADFAVDDVEDSTQVKLRLSVDMYDPSDLENRIGTVAPFSYTYRYPSGRRSVRSLLEVDARENLADGAARQTLTKILSDMQMESGLQESTVQ